MTPPPVAVTMMIGPLRDADGAHFHIQLRGFLHPSEESVTIFAAEAAAQMLEDPDIMRVEVETLEKMHKAVRESPEANEALEEAYRHVPPPTPDLPQA